MPNVLVDTGVWYALFDADDGRHRDAKKRFARLEGSATRTILPWPVVYETLRTQFVRNQPALDGFEKLIGASRVVKLDDAKYREPALSEVFRSARKGRPLSLVDCTLRLILQDANVRANGLFTFNVRDFVDVCREREIVVI